MSDFVQKNPCEICTHITSNSYSEYPKSNQVHFICLSCYKERNARQSAEVHEFITTNKKFVAFLEQQKANLQKSRAQNLRKSDAW